MDLTISETQGGVDQPGEMGFPGLTDVFLREPLPSVFRRKDDRRDFNLASDPSSPCSMNNNRLMRISFGEGLP